MNLPSVKFVHESLLKARRLNDGRVEVLVRWKYMDESLDTWEPAESLPANIFGPSVDHQVQQLLSSNEGKVEAIEAQFGDNIYAIEKVIFAADIAERTYVYIKWEHYPMSEANWEPVDNVTDYAAVATDIREARRRANLFFARNGGFSSVSENDAAEKPGFKERRDKKRLSLASNSLRPRRRLRRGLSQDSSSATTRVEISSAASSEGRPSSSAPLEWSSSSDSSCSSLPFRGSRKKRFVMSESPSCSFEAPRFLPQADRLKRNSSSFSKSKRQVLGAAKRSKRTTEASGVRKNKAPLPSKTLTSSILRLTTGCGVADVLGPNLALGDPYTVEICARLLAAFQKQEQMISRVARPAYVKMLENLKLLYETVCHSVDLHGAASFPPLLTVEKSCVAPETSTILRSVAHDAGDPPEKLVAQAVCEALVVRPVPSPPRVTSSPSRQILEKDQDMPVDLGQGEEVDIMSNFSHSDGSAVAQNQSVERQDISSVDDAVDQTLKQNDNAVPVIDEGHGNESALQNELIEVRKHVERELRAQAESQKSLRSRLERLLNNHETQLSVSDVTPAANGSFSNTMSSVQQASVSLARNLQQATSLPIEASHTDALRRKPSETELTAPSKTSQQLVLPSPNVLPGLPSSGVDPVCTGPPPSTGLVGFVAPTGDYVTQSSSVDSRESSVQRNNSFLVNRRDGSYLADPQRNTSVGPEARQSLNSVNRNVLIPYQATQNFGTSPSQGESNAVSSVSCNDAIQYIARQQRLPTPTTNSFFNGTDDAALRIYFGGNTNVGNTSVGPIPPLPQQLLFGARNYTSRDPVHGTLLSLGFSDPNNQSRSDWPSSTLKPGPSWRAVSCPGTEKPGLFSTEHPTAQTQGADALQYQRAAYYPYTQHPSSVPQTFQFAPQSPPDHVGYYQNLLQQILLQQAAVAAAQGCPPQCLPSPRYAAAPDNDRRPPRSTKTVPNRHPKSNFRDTQQHPETSKPRPLLTGYTRYGRPVYTNAANFRYSSVQRSAPSGAGESITDHRSLPAASEVGSTRSVGTSVSSKHSNLVPAISNVSTDVRSTAVTVAGRGQMCYPKISSANWNLQLANDNNPLPSFSVTPRTLKYCGVKVPEFQPWTELRRASAASVHNLVANLPIQRKTFAVTRCYCQFLEGRPSQEISSVTDWFAKKGLPESKQGLKCTVCSFHDHLACSIAWNSLLLQPENLDAELESLLEGYVCVPCRLHFLDPLMPVQRVLALSLAHLPPSPGFTATPPQTATKTVELEFRFSQTEVIGLETATLRVEIRGTELSPTAYRFSGFPRQVAFRVNVPASSSPTFVLKVPGLHRKRKEEPQPIPTASLQLRKRNYVSLECTYSSAASYLFAAVLVSPVTSDSILETTKQHNWLPLPLCRSLCQAMAQEKNQNLDSNDDVVAECQDVSLTSLRCPSTLMRIELPGRGFYCKHLQCFDVAFYIPSQTRIASHKNRWKCPVCYRFCYPHEIILDNFFKDILEKTSELDRTVFLLFNDDALTWRVTEKDDPDETEEKSASNGLPAATPSVSPDSSFPTPKAELSASTSGSNHAAGQQASTGTKSPFPGSSKPADAVASAFGLAGSAQMPIIDLE